jgi:hypothetical protein
MHKDAVFAQGVFGGMIFGEHAVNPCRWIRIMPPCEAGSLPDNGSIPVDDPFFEDSFVAIYGYDVIGCMVFGQTYLQEPTVPPEPTEPVDDEDEIDLTLVILDIPFDEATVAGTLDHSVYERPIIKSAGSFLSIDTARLKLLKTSVASYDGVFLVDKMPPYPEHYYIVFNVNLPAIGYSTSTRLISSDNSANYLFGTTLRIDSESGSIKMLDPAFGGDPDYPLTNGDHLIEYEVIGNQGTVKVDSTLAFDWTIRSDKLFSGTYVFNTVEPANSNGNTNILIKDVQIQYKYHGTPWWINSIIDFNFKEATLLATLDHSPIRHPTVSTNFSETVYKDLSIVTVDDYTSGLRLTRTSGDYSDGIRIYPVYVATGDISFEFYFEHNATPPSTSVSNSGTILELQTSPSSIYFNMEHPLGDGDAYIAFYGATFGSEHGGTPDDYYRWIKCEPNSRKKYTVNYVGGIATVHVDGVLHLTGTCDDRSLVARQAFRVFGFNGSSDGLVWTIDSVIVTNNYYLDPSKVRVIPE